MKDKDIKDVIDIKELIERKKNNENNKDEESIHAFKLRLVNKEIKMIKEHRAFDKKTNATLIFVDIAVFILLLLINHGKPLSALSTISISFFTAASYKMFCDMQSHKLDDIFKLQRLEIEKGVLEALVSGVSEEEIEKKLEEVLGELCDDLDIDIKKKD